MAELVIARVQVARAYRHGADLVRKKARTRRTRGLPTAASAARKGVMWPCRQRPVDRKPRAWERLERGFAGSPTIAAASHRRADLTDLVQRDDTTVGATCALPAWGTRVRASGLAEFERVLGTRARGMEAITHDCQRRQTSGLVAGFNTRVTGLKRRGSGIFDVGRRCPRLTRDLHGSPRCGHP